MKRPRGPKKVVVHVLVSLALEVDEALALGDDLSGCSPCSGVVGIGRLLLVITIAIPVLNW